MNVKIMGADASKTNAVGGHWTPGLQASAKQSRLYKLSVTALADLYVWIYDLAAGTVTSAAPVHVRYCPSGSADTWDFGADGSLFQNGIYILAATGLPTDPTTAATAVAQDLAILKADIRSG